MRVVVDTETMPKEVGDVIEQLRKENTQLKSKVTRCEARLTNFQQERRKYEEAIGRVGDLGTYLHTMGIGDHWDHYDDE